MALSPQDQRFYEEKLGWKSFLLVYVATILIGAVIWPAMLYSMDASAGTTSKWDSHMVIMLAFSGVMLGTIVTVVMYLGFKFLLQVGWLPARK